MARSFYLFQVLNENFEALPNMSANAFARKFINKSFDLPSRKLKISTTGFRVCDVTIKQYRPAINSYEVEHSNPAAQFSLSKKISS
jgi:hypothetical protein